MMLEYFLNHSRDNPTPSNIHTGKQTLQNSIATQKSCPILGFTLIEMMLSVCIIGIVTGIAVPAYSNYKDKTDRAQAVAEMGGIAIIIEKFYAENNRYPDSLDDIGKGTLKDPWGRTYRYLNIANDPHQKYCRKLGPIHPLNTDFDLYSPGKDGQSNKPINSEPSMDDIIRAYDGRYFGIAQDLI